MSLKADLIKLTDERNEWKTRCEFSFQQRDKLTAERDAYAKCSDDMAASHKVERDLLTANVTRLMARQAAYEKGVTDSGVYLKVERDALRADAERYRYLRSKQMQYSLPNDTVALLVADMTALDATMKETK